MSAFAASIDDEWICPVGIDCPLVDQRDLPISETAGARNDVVDVGQRDARIGAGDHVLAAVRQDDLTAALKRDAVLDELQVGFIAGRTQCDGAGVVNHAAQRQHGAVADHHVAGVVGDRHLIEYEIAGAKKCCIDADERDRLAVAERDHRIALCIVGQTGLDIAEACDASKSDQIDGVGRDVEIVDGVVADRLGEDEQIVRAGPGERIVARLTRRWAAPSA